MLIKKLSIIFGATLFFVFMFTSCKTESLSTKTQAYYSFKDDLGNEVVLKEKPDSVVSLFGSYAETWVFAGGELAGVTSDAVTERDMNLPQDIVNIGTVKAPSLEAILALSPDFILLSADIESHKKISITLKELNISHAFFKVEHFKDYLNMLKICTDITGRKDFYKQYGMDVQNDIDNALSKVDYDIRPRVLLIRAFSTGAKAKTDDSMTGKILTDLGCYNIASKHKSLLETLSVEEIISEDPDFIFVVTMGDSEAAIKAIKGGIQNNPAWGELSAVKDNRYIILPKELFHYKPNARWGEAYEYLSKILYSNN